MSNIEGESQKSWFSDDTMGLTARDTASSYERIHDPSMWGPNIFVEKTCGKPR